MVSQSQVAQNGCEHQAEDDADRRANLVGRMVWRIVDAEAPQSGRSIFLLTGLEPRHLAGVSRTRPTLDSRTLKLAISPRIDPDLLSDLEPCHLSDDPPVSFRNSDGADVVVLAVPDSERDAVGSSLGDLVRIDRSRLQSEIGHWCDEIKVGINAEDLPRGKTAWLEAMIRGLDMSCATNELDQFAEFVDRFIAFPDGWLFTERLRQLGPVLALPRGTFDSIPPETPGKSVKAEDFRRMFRDARDKYAGIAYLRSPDDKRLDADSIMERVRHFQGRLEDGASHLDDPSANLLDAIEDLVNAQSRLRQGDWLDCQAELCEQLDWSQDGEKIFGVRNRKKALSLAEKTLEHFERDYDKRLPDVKDFLEDFKDPTKPQSDEVKEAFFDENEDAIRTNKRLYEEWRRHLFASTVNDQQDLLAAVLDGVQAVFVKNTEANHDIGDDLRFFVAVKDCEKASTWESLDRRTYTLFRQEGRLISQALGNKIEFRFGKWLDENAIKQAEDQTRKELRAIELEVGIAKADRSEESRFQRVRVFWRPSENGKDSIALAWPEDIEGLVAGMSENRVAVPREKIAPRGTSASRHLPMSIHDTSSFSDAAQGEKGRTTDPAGKPLDEDIFEIIPRQLGDFVDRNIIADAVRDDLLQALEQFREAFSKTLSAFWETPEQVYASALIRTQADLFGELCSKARSLLSDVTERVF
ncbi:hypothetical protein [Ruegeria sediminis]|uniref:hypothetical protein n=1 Tax=Ruegeria sediminis TaxID=2583820 RepID=UPI0014870D41|nr:hypothetical protein [Ruegeria sediminis]